MFPSSGLGFEPGAPPGGPAPRRHYVFVDPGVADSPSDTPDSAGAPDSPGAGLPNRIGRAALACAALDKTVLICCPTRKFAEQCYASARKACEERGLDPNCLRLDYDGPADGLRSEIQAGMRDGAVKAVFSADAPETVAWETGLFPGGLDGVILAGFPDTLQATWQRLQQARGGLEREAFALCYALNDPMARFYAHNLPAFLDRKGEEIVVAPGNREIIRAHLPSLLREAEGRIYSFSAEFLGDTIFRELPGNRETEPAPEFPQEEVSLRDLPGQTWSLRRENEPVGSLSAARKFHEAYAGAIYFQAGVRYRVSRSEEASDVNSDAPPTIHLLELESPDQENRITVPCLEKTLEIREEYRYSGWAGGVAAFLGNVTLSEKLNSVKVIDESLRPNPAEAEDSRDSPHNSREEDRAGAGRVIDTYTPSGDTTWESTGHAFWLDVAGIINGAGDGAAADAEVPAGVPAEGQDGEQDAGLAALEQMLRVGALFTFPADFHDTTTHWAGGKIFLIERYPGGIGLAQQAFDRWRELLEVAMELAKGCQCATGCAYCLIPPRSGAVRLDKVRGIELARCLLQATGGSPAESTGAR